MNIEHTEWEIKDPCPGGHNNGARLMNSHSNFRTSTHYDKQYKICRIYSKVSGVYDKSIQKTCWLHCVIYVCSELVASVLYQCQRHILENCRWSSRASYRTFDVWPDTVCSCVRTWGHKQQDTWPVWQRSCFEEIPIFLFLKILQKYSKILRTIAILGERHCLFAKVLSFGFA